MKTLKEEKRELEKKYSMLKKLALDAGVEIPISNKKSSFSKSNNNVTLDTITKENASQVAAATGISKLNKEEKIKKKGQKVFWVDVIREHIESDGVYHFHVHWFGYIEQENTWEDLSCFEIDDEPIDEYLVTKFKMKRAFSKPEDQSSAFLVPLEVVILVKPQEQGLSTPITMDIPQVHILSSPQ